MNELDDQELADLQKLEATHTKVLKVFGKKHEHRHIVTVMTVGGVSWRTMKAYCENHNVECPNWPEISR